MTPVAAETVRPVGSAPLAMCQVYGAVPPVAASEALYATPTVPAGRDAVAIVMGVEPCDETELVELFATGLTVSASATVLDCAGVPEAATAKLIEALVVAVVGVPDMMPVVADKDSPVGSVPPATDQVYGLPPPLATSVAVYATPTCAAGSEVVMMATDCDCTAEAEPGSPPLLPLPPPQPATKSVTAITETSENSRLTGFGVVFGTDTMEPIGNL
jgi:hypothetical protein